MKLLELAEQYEADNSIFTDLEKKVLDYGLFCVIEELKMARKSLENHYEPNTIDIKTYIQLGFAVLHGKGRSCHEKLSKRTLILLWNYLFDEYEFLGSEVGLPSGLRMDVLVKEKDTGIPCVVELKHTLSPSESKQAYEQLARYSNELSDLCGTKVEKMAITLQGLFLDKSTYVTAWYELGIDQEFAVPPPHFDRSALHKLCVEKNIKPKQLDFGLAYHYDVLQAYIENYEPSSMLVPSRTPTGSNDCIANLISNRPQG